MTHPIPKSTWMILKKMNGGFKESYHWKNTKDNQRVCRCVVMMSWCQYYVIDDVALILMVTKPMCQLILWCVHISYPGMSDDGVKSIMYTQSYPVYVCTVVWIWYISRPFCSNESLNTVFKRGWFFFLYYL